MALDDYKVVIYRNQPTGWVAEVPSIPGCYAIMPTRAEALVELEEVFRMLGYRSVAPASDTTRIAHASSGASKSD